MTAHLDPSVAARKATMEARLADLKARLSAIEEELDSHVERDWEEAAVEREGDEVLEATGVSSQNEIRMIEAALRRVDEGEYGFCGKCGAEIAPERLDAVPYTPFCRTCAT
ncbi:TraR/DksA C4-type zinc finger protein [Rhodobacter sp. Har01]|uniref:TraR/DksA family transcriptional regulator n=1 Tax=Rhodobacter sp. Har01 TaxID=2883999 RepID=UPI001D076459|nr:TraR/DksA C4-type zinc finger protein [Rhodobacter sp. Har01]MCB6177547.1 TraR/DksA C4-type zinc finger protein [Rhodobacter sp. Har01]